jgi:hypothetical protein
MAARIIDAAPKLMKSHTREREDEVEAATTASIVRTSLTDAPALHFHAKAQVSLDRLQEGVYLPSRYSGGTS